MIFNWILSILDIKINIYEKRPTTNKFVTSKNIIYSIDLTGKKAIIAATKLLKVQNMEQFSLSRKWNNARKYLL